ncbi:hypothetical protein FACS1894158_11280 [Betaproteobacteria bacterium]|nr:hypothetical protein FACS1894158_11280 [Betaproteobacteria bacterium]
MTHSLRALFRLMLLAWFALVIAMAIALKAHLPSESAGTLVENLFTRPVPPPPMPVLRKEAPRFLVPVPISQPVPQPVQKPVPEPWRKLKEGRGLGTGSLGVPEIVELPGGDIELHFPFQGAPGDISFYRMDAKGSLSVDLHGDFRLQRAVERVLMTGFLRRLQVYPHPGYLRISGMGRTRDLLPRINAAAFVSEDKRLRVVFKLDEARAPASPAATTPSGRQAKVDEADNREKPNAPPAAPL